MDIQEQVKKLIENGLSCEQIGQQVRANQSTIHRISKGAEPKYNLGCRLAELYKNHVAAHASE